jgi:hypothetical protein
MPKIFLITSYVNISSDIIEFNYREEFGDLLDISIDRKWDLLYRATRDGFKASDFHDKCDGKSDTLVIIKAESGNVFGGYTHLTWDTSGSDKSSTSDYIFSFRNKLNKKLKMHKRYNSLLSSIFCSAKYGPVFGYNSRYENSDFTIADSSNTNESSYSDLGCAFSHPSYERGSIEAETLLAGSKNFKVAEIEVFQSI